MKYFVGFLKIVWTIVKVITIPVGAIALLMQYILVDGIGLEKSLDLKIKFYEDAKKFLADKVLEDH